MSLNSESTVSIYSIYSILQAINKYSDWRAALDNVLASLREEFVYDNVAVYVIDSGGGGLDVAYARAVGRGKRAEADISWGDAIAGEVMSQQEMIVHEPGADPDTDRLDLPHLLGLPIFTGGRLTGVLVFIRFGGPNYSPIHRQLAVVIKTVVSSLLESRALRDARDQLESVQKQMRLQDDFVSTISHELRTPLGFIKGYSTSLLRADTKWDEKTQREFLGIIDDEADRLTYLIENMLESARLQSKTLQFKFQPLRLDSLIRDVTTRIYTHHPALQVNFDFEAIPLIFGDGVRLSQVFENLFGNAMKYAAGSPLTIRMRHSTKTLHIDFADRGPGIPEDYLPFIFERFYRVPGSSTITGTGLGLYICKQIILAHHGKIRAESVLDEGTTFFIELPIDPKP
jgi:signal transduction histidine kinase